MSLRPESDCVGSGFVDGHTGEVVCTTGAELMGRLVVCVPERRGSEMVRYGVVG